MILYPRAFGTLGRNVFRDTGFRDWDFSIVNNGKFGERYTAQFRAEFFNIFNHTQFLNPDGNISDGADFGRVKHTREPRNIQFALKFAF